MRKLNEEIELGAVRVRVLGTRIGNRSRRMRRRRRRRRKLNSSELLPVGKRIKMNVR